MKQENSMAPKTKAEPKFELTKPMVLTKTETTPSRNRDIKCFKHQDNGQIASHRPNRRIMVIKESDDIQTNYDDFDYDDMPPLEDVDGEEVMPP